MFYICRFVSHAYMQFFCINLYLPAILYEIERLDLLWNMLNYISRGKLSIKFRDKCIIYHIICSQIIFFVTYDSNTLAAYEGCTLSMPIVITE